MADLADRSPEGLRRAARYKRMLLVAVLAFSLHGVVLINAVEQTTWLGWALYGGVIASLLVVFVVDWRLKLRRRLRADEHLAGAEQVVADVSREQGH